MRSRLDVCACGCNVAGMSEPTTKVTYYRTAIVKRFVDDWNPRDGEWAGGIEHEFEVTESTNTPNEMLACERKLIRITKVTTTTEVVG